MHFLGFDLNFWQALWRSLLAGAAVAGASLAVGWPLGVQAGLTRFPFCRTLFALLTAPLLVPSFLTGIGLSMLCRGMGGAVAVIWAFSCLGIPLVTFSALAATHSITRGQADAARLAGGEAHLFRLALRAAFPLAGLAAALAGVLTLADPGPGQIFGWQGAAGELLVSFAARYDRLLATRQALMLAVVASVVAWPLAWKFAPEVAAGLFARDVIHAEQRYSRATGGWIFGVVAVVVFLPLAGLLKPLLAHVWPVARAWSEIQRTAVDTVLYAALAAGLAVTMAFTLVWSAGRSVSRRRWLVAIALALLALPPALLALWLVPYSGFISVGFALALRGLPLTLLFALRAVGSMPSSWADAARVHRVTPYAFFLRVVLPWCSRWAWPAAALAALLGTAEVGTILLLHPPGHGNLPLAVFTIMANAPEALVSMLCLLYFGLAALVAVAAQHIVRRL